MKRFISELGENFSELMKKRLLELEIRCVLTRKEDVHKLDLKHVEHTKYPCDSSDNSHKCKKEYAYAQFIIFEDELYFSDKCIENDTVMQSPVVDTIYNSLNSKNVTFEDGTNGKKIDDSNIDYVIDNILEACPEVSKRYVEIVKQMTSY